MAPTPQHLCLTPLPLQSLPAPRSENQEGGRSILAVPAPEATKPCWAPGSSLRKLQSSCRIPRAKPSPFPCATAPSGSKICSASVVEGPVKVSGPCLLLGYPLTSVPTDFLSGMCKKSKERQKMGRKIQDFLTAQSPGMWGGRKAPNPWFCLRAIMCK